MLSFTSCGARTPPLCATTLNLVRARRAPPATRAPCIPRPRARPALTILCLSICTLGLIYGNNSNSKSKLALLTQSIAYANTLYALILAYLHSTTFFVRAGRDRVPDPRAAPGGNEAPVARRLGASLADSWYTGCVVNVGKRGVSSVAAERAGVG